MLVALRPSLLPVVLMLVLLQRHWQALTTFLVLFASLSALTVPLLGFAWPLRYFSLLLDPALPAGAPPMIGDTMYNWRGIAGLVFGPDAHPLVPSFVFVFGLGLLLFVWMRSGMILEPEREQTRSAADTTVQRLNSDVLWALAGLLAVFAAPNLSAHDLTLLIFPGWVIGIYAMTNRFGRRASAVWRLALAVGYAIFPISLVLQGADADASWLVLASAVLMLAAVLWLALFMPAREEHPVY
jgi:hypothetical protein